MVVVIGNREREREKGTARSTILEQSLPSVYCGRLVMYTYTQIGGSGYLQQCIALLHLCVPLERYDVPLLQLPYCIRYQWCEKRERQRERDTDTGRKKRGQESRFYHIIQYTIQYVLYLLYSTIPYYTATLFRLIFAAHPILLTVLLLFTTTASTNTTAHYSTTLQTPA